MPNKKKVYIKGPWVINLTHKMLIDRSIKGIAITDKENTIIADVRRGNKGSIGQCINVELIRSVPEMYECLHAVLPFMQNDVHLVNAKDEAKIKKLYNKIKTTLEKIDTFLS